MLYSIILYAHYLFSSLTSCHTCLQHVLWVSNSSNILSNISLILNKSFIFISIFRKCYSVFIFSAMACYVFFCNTIFLLPIFATLPLQKLFKILCNIIRWNLHISWNRVLIFFFQFPDGNIPYFKSSSNFSVTFRFVCHHEFPVINFLSSLYIDVYFLNLELKLCIFLINIHCLIIGRKSSFFSIYHSLICLEIIAVIFPYMHSVWWLQHSLRC